MHKEIWKDIPGYSGKHQASSLGRIKSLDRTIEYESNIKNQFMIEPVIRKRTYKLNGKIKNPTIGNHGYYVINLGFKDLHTVHTLIAKTFLNKSNDRLIINHKNGIKTDNRLENLEWVSYSENLIHAYKNNLTKRIGLTQHDKIHITHEYFTNCRTRKIMDKIARGYGVSIKTISRIIKNQNCDKNNSFK